MVTHGAAAAARLGADGTRLELGEANLVLHDGGEFTMNDVAARAGARGSVLAGAAVGSVRVRRASCTQSNARRVQSCD